MTETRMTKTRMTKTRMTETRMPEADLDRDTSAKVVGDAVVLQVVQDVLLHLVVFLHDDHRDHDEQDEAGQEVFHEIVVLKMQGEGRCYDFKNIFVLKLAILTQI
jgi:hypothetical protein